MQVPERSAPLSWRRARRLKRFRFRWVAALPKGPRIWSEREPDRCCLLSVQLFCVAAAFIDSVLIFFAFPSLLFPFVSLNNVTFRGDPPADNVRRYLNSRACNPNHIFWRALRGWKIEYFIEIFEFNFLFLLKYLRPLTLTIDIWLDFFNSLKRDIHGKLSWQMTEGLKGKRAYIKICWSIQKPLSGSYLRSCFRKVTFRLYELNLSHSLFKQPTRQKEQPSVDFQNRFTTIFFRQVLQFSIFGKAKLPDKNSSYLDTRRYG